MTKSENCLWALVSALRNEDEEIDEAARLSLTMSL